MYFSLNTWQIRNDILHKDRVDTEYKTERRELCKRTRWWYRQAVILGTKMKKYFKKTALERQKGSNLQIADWNDTLESHCKYLIDRGQDVGIVPMPAPRERRGG